jgi:NAD(P)H-flavin reductase/hemoglobin-like flavoprotein
MTNGEGGTPGQLPKNSPAVHASLVKESFAHIEPLADKATAYFYGRLFAEHPELRALFPLAMDRQRDLFFRALAAIVWSMDCPEGLTASLQQLGRDHRRFGVQARHYPEFTGALLATIREFAGPGWTEETGAAWEATLRIVTQTMTEAAAADAKQVPAWWLAEVISHQRRAADLAVLTLRPSQPLSYLPGQYLSVQSARWPREWRNYSPANAPRPDGTIDLHVRTIPGGMVSTALVHHTIPGETLLLGPAQGAMTLPPDSTRDLLCVAGGTGLAPVKAIIEQAVAAGAAQRAITLLFGARTETGRYDHRDLDRLAIAVPSLEIITVISDDPGFDGPRGTLPDVTAERAAGMTSREVYVCGPPAMVRQTRAVLAGLGVPPGRLHYDEPEPEFGRPAPGEPPAQGTPPASGQGKAEA